MTAHEIPVINVAPFLAPNSTQAERDAVVVQVRDACRVYGFFQLEGHGISQELQDEVFRCAKTFFALPLEEKQKVGMHHAVGKSNRGYEMIGQQQLQYDALPDYKEGIYIGAEIPPDDARAGKFLQGPNLWPASLPDETFRKPITQYRAETLELAHKLLRILVLGLPYGANVLEEFTFQPVANIRLLHYPPQESTDQRHVGAGAHTDFGCITLLLQEPDQTGLEVLYPPTNEWIPVPAVAGRYVVNIGDLLQGWTAGEYRSAMHRVRNLGGKDRYSIPFFYNGNMDFTLRPLDGSDDAHAITVEQHIQNKFSASYSLKAQKGSA
ncbi:Oxoglutarate/iron-dependent oxygenase [Niveomyces insectorum RCEF 264]|uniref:Oxoglutarate/iron-dependent oxygenase n=1 Tax=Niveomyces insectorum RCEF 264 TaxID=1081102 RepID=A0A167NS15_9HYPO|nr:Oxoglutarate/iron-dependent oxygenase [Niveomyces insectorum RCEF 264]